MKTNKNQIRNNRIGILFSLAALSFFPFYNNAQINIDSYGKVGIGTTTPANILSLSNAAAQKIWIENTASGTVGRNLTVAAGSTVGGTNVTGGSNIIQAGVGTGTGASTILFQNGTTLGSGATLQTMSTKMTILGNGNVGIGITNPNVALTLPYTSTGIGFSYSSSNTNVYSSISKPADGAGPLLFKANWSSWPSSAKLYEFQGASANVVMNMYNDGYVSIPGYESIGGDLTVGGNIEINGYATCATGYWSGSDAMFKTNIDSLHNALTTIRQLKPKTYYFDTVNFPEFNFISKKQYGFVAQELEQILPDLVKSIKKSGGLDSVANAAHPAVSYKAVNYIELIALLTKGIQEMDATFIKSEAEHQKMIATLDSTIKAQNSKINDLQNQIAICCAKTPTDKSMINKDNISIDAGNSNTSAILYQNIPNPFNQQTSIQYFIPTTAQSASIMVFDLNGKLMSTIPVTSFGKGAITINGNQLNPGMFVYSLVVDGKIIDTKRMILTQ